ncbi:NmrA family NAD(P)-binding protein [Rhizobium sp. 16-449-1b]|uniref:SDR family oxidoreductase n=1 Tax=Rhizobium sp. 16-449-1b TaxID=2819989 RepID=UPI001AD9FE10|nr:NmrA family NAD(P)-binding protein [Rhizobium sp. 16-449-1b]MBO9198184.1 NmrA family NAD(P)-binding protein [Rhizobium sp. 16-449-1b]
MRIVVVGASGMMGSKIVRALGSSGHSVVEASSKTGVDAIKGVGLDTAFEGADAVIDVTNSGSFGEGDALSFFKQAGKNLLSAAKRAGVPHYLALSVVGAERLVENDYFRAKLVQENLIRASSVPYTIVRSTQFFEFFGGIVNSSPAVEGSIRVANVRLQPISADEAATIVAKHASGKPINSVQEIGGPEPLNLLEIARELLTATEDARPVATDPDVAYFGVNLAPESLVPAAKAISGKQSFHDWLSNTVSA